MFNKFYSPYLLRYLFIMIQILWLLIHRTFSITTCTFCSSCFRFFFSPPLEIQILLFELFNFPPSLWTFLIWKFLVFGLSLKIQSTQTMSQISRFSNTWEYLNLGNTFLYPFIINIFIPLEKYQYVIYTINIDEINVYM